MNDNEEKDNLDNFFKEHFASLPKFEESENRDKILLNILLARIEEQRKEQEYLKQNPSLFGRMRHLLMDFTFYAPKFAIPLALLLVFIIAFLIYNNNQQSNISPKIAKNQTIKQSDSTIAKNNVVVEENDVAINETQIVELGKLNYDFASRTVSDENLNNDSLISNVKEIISNYFSNNKIAYKKNKLKFETTELNFDNKVYHLELNLNKNSKEINFLLYQSNQTNSNLKNISPKKIKNDLQDELMKNLLNME